MDTWRSWRWSPANDFESRAIDSAERTRLAALKQDSLYGKAHDLAVTPDGEFAYVAGRTGDLYKVSIAERSLVKTIEESFGGYGATCIRVSPDGKYAYVAGDKDRRRHAFATQGHSEAWALDLHAQGLCVSPCTAGLSSLPFPTRIRSLRVLQQS